jgi:hypothetical protein
MSFAEFFNVLFFCAISALALFVPIPLHRRISAWAIGGFGTAVSVFLAYSQVLLSEQTSVVLRNWLPAGLILVAYHQSGRLFVKPWSRFQDFLLGLDRKLLGRLFQEPEEIKLNAFLSAYLEISYLACYPLIPAALGALILLDPQSVEEFWMVVLPSAYFCYALVPIFPAYPPRLLNADRKAPIRPGKSRAFNMWILQYASIQANTFPSAHVAACTAASLVLLKYDPLVGLGFLWVSLSIAVAAVMRRYHYLADVVLGIMFPFIPFFLAGG